MKVIYQQDHTGIDIGNVPAVFKPEVGPFKLTYLEKVYGTDPAADIFELRGLDRGGVVVVVRPDQYVANVLPLTATAELAAFFAPLLRTGHRPANCRITRAELRHRVLEMARRHAGVVRALARSEAECCGAQPGTCMPVRYSAAA